MRIAVYLPLLLAAVLALASPLLARQLSPAWAAPALTTAAAVTALASTWGLGMLAVAFLARTSPVAEEAHVSRATLVAHDPVPALISLLAGLVLVWGIGRATRVISTRRRTWRTARRLCQAWAADSELIVLADRQPQAFALPGRPGRVVVSTGMLHALAQPEREVLLAHERSHLRHHHHRYAAATALAAGVNPLLRRTQRDVDYLIERWADEDAAAAVGSRRLAADSLAKAALATAEESAQHVVGRPALAFERLRVVRRVAALQLEAPGRHPLPVVACTLLTVASGAAAIDATVAFLRFVLALAGLFHGTHG